jgi:hypothetical protein
MAREGTVVNHKRLYRLYRRPACRSVAAGANA